MGSFARNGADMMEQVSSTGQDTPVPVLDSARQWRLVGLAVAAVVGLFWGLPWAWGVLFPPPPEAPARGGDGSFQATAREWATLRFEAAHRDDFANGVTTDGQIATDDDHTTPVFSPFTGQVTRIMVAAGDHVRRGQPLFAVAASEAGQSEADILAASAQLKSAEAEEKRLHDLYQHQGAALKDWEQSEADLASARGAMTAAAARRRALGARIAHGEGVVLAPVAGTVTQRLIGPGQMLSGTASGNGTQAMAISDLSRVWVVGNLREEDAAKAHAGQAVLVRLLVDPAHPIHARLDYAGAMLDPVTRRLPVRAVLDNADGRLKPGLFATVTLLTGGARRSLSVPESAVIYEGDTARVWVARGKDRALALRPVVAGEKRDGRVEILSGLREGESVVTAGALFIDRGAKVD